MKLTLSQFEALRMIQAGEVRQHRFGYGAWRILGASPTVVGRLVSMRLAKWGQLTATRPIRKFSPIDGVFEIEETT